MCERLSPLLCCSFHYFEASKQIIPQQPTSTFLPYICGVTLCVYFLPRLLALLKKHMQNRIFSIKVVALCCNWWLLRTEGAEKQTSGFTFRRLSSSAWRGIHYLAHLFECCLYLMMSNVFPIVPLYLTVSASTRCCGTAQVGTRTNGEYSF